MCSLKKNELPVQCGISSLLMGLETILLNMLSLCRTETMRGIFGKPLSNAKIRQYVEKGKDDAFLKK